MFLAELRIENFRNFGEGRDALTLSLRPGLTVLVGENDVGKTAIMDAIRLALGTPDQEYIHVDESDFHQPRDGTARKTEIRIRCKFAELAPPEVAAFIEYLTYEKKESATVPALYVTWRASAAFRGDRRYIASDTRSGPDGDGPHLHQEVKILLRATYMRPLRDAERALSAGRGSRLSQILQNTKEVREHGTDYDLANGPPSDLSALSVLGIANLADALLREHKGVSKARDRLNEEFLRELSFNDSLLEGFISVGGVMGDANLRLRQLLEKLEVNLGTGEEQAITNRGLGSNNLLFMACELLLLGSETGTLPLLLVEEPEAHLHPQRQLRLIQFLRQKAETPRPDGQKIQIIITTHSPNLASAVQLDNLVLISNGRAFPLRAGLTKLDPSDYGFLSRFLDVTKANLFFARGLLIVEGDAENILFPTLARILQRDFAASGVSIVNVGGIGLRRFARIFMRKDPSSDGTIPVPVACVADMDVMPDCAPEILGKVEADEAWPNTTERRWRAKKDFTPEGLKARRRQIGDKASGQNVETFVADEWTFEYDLAYAGLAREVWVASQLAASDDHISAGKATWFSVARDALRDFNSIKDEHPEVDIMATFVYARFLRDSKISKATAAQYLSGILETRYERGRLTPEALRAALPAYVVAAIEHVSRPPKNAAPAKEADEVVGVPVS